MKTTRALSGPSTRGRRHLVVLNVLGGLAVLGSYALALALSPEIRSGLWGGVPDALRPLYTVCMFLAAAGYFPFTWQLVLRAGPAGLAREVGAPQGSLLVCYALVLIPSALWLPLTALHQTAPSMPLWLLIRGVLMLVGLGATGIALLSFRWARHQGGASWLGFAGSLPFWIQTAVLDAIVWPAYYFRPAGF